MKDYSRISYRKPKIDVVPLIDVLMVLIVFLVTMQFTDLRALNVKLPKIESAGSNLIRNELIISIQENGIIFVNGSKSTTNSLGKILEQVLTCP